VQVFAEGRNIAGSGTARQSSTAHGGDAQRAVDGNTNGSYGSGAETHTNENEVRPWWELDLKSPQPISGIAIWNRTENNGGYADRLEGFTLTVLDADRREVFKKTGNPAPKESVRIELQGDPAGALRRAAIRALPGLGNGTADRVRLAGRSHQERRTDDHRRAGDHAGAAHRVGEGPGRARRLRARRVGRQGAGGWAHGAGLHRDCAGPRTNSLPSSRRRRRHRAQGAQGICA